MVWLPEISLQKAAKLCSLWSSLKTAGVKQRAVEVKHEVQNMVMLCLEKFHQLRTNLRMESCRMVQSLLPRYFVHHLIHSEETNWGLKYFLPSPVQRKQLRRYILLNITGACGLSEVGQSMPTHQNVQYVTRTTKRSINAWPFRDSGTSWEQPPYL